MNMGGSKDPPACNADTSFLIVGDGLPDVPKNGLSRRDALNKCAGGAFVAKAGSDL